VIRQIELEPVPNKVRLVSLHAWSVSSRRTDRPHMVQAGGQKRTHLPLRSALSICSVVRSSTAIGDLDRGSREQVR
jgi:hypothetical protein